MLTFSYSASALIRAMMSSRSSTVPARRGMVPGCSASAPRRLEETHVCEQVPAADCQGSTVRSAKVVASDRLVLPTRKCCTKQLRTLMVKPLGRVTERHLGHYHTGCNERSSNQVSNADRSSMGRRLMRRCVGAYECRAL